MGNKDKKKQQRAATPEQMNFINESIRSAGLGDSLDDFASRFVSDSYRANFATTLSKQLQATQSIADGLQKTEHFSLSCQSSYISS